MYIAKIEWPQAVLLGGIANLKGEANLQNILRSMEQDFEMGVYVHQYILAELVRFVDRGWITVNDCTAYDRIVYTITDKGMATVKKFERDEKRAYEKRVKAQKVQS